MNATPDTGRDLASGVYDPAVTSDGLTTDTPFGPVDLVAIERARAGRPVALTPAERHHLHTLLAAGPVSRHSARVIRAAAALGLRPASIERAVMRHRRAVSA